MSELPSAETSVEVSLGERSYRILIGNNRLGELVGEVISRLRPINHVVFIADQAIEGYLGSIICALDQSSIRHDCILIPSGEASKSIEQLNSIWNYLLQSKTDRSSIVIAVGGGVIGDLAGFAAASFARGLRFVQIPTTLLAMVDSSVGGKTGINLPTAKNMVGAFWQPAAVIIDMSLLATLPEREFRSGLAEIVKYGVILDPPLFEYIERHASAILDRDSKVLQHIVMRSCRLKADVVEQDERETTGLRAILNYGHTFAHALESATQYGSLLHGEAVSIGMTMAGELAVELGMWTRAECDRQTALLNDLKLPISLSKADPTLLWSLMQHDKKVEQGVLRFILPTCIGRVEPRSGVTREQAVQAISHCVRN
jgi:3-dehydroquinate synthase